MLSRKPYLIRAIYEWIADSGHTPYLLIDTTVAGIEAPMQFAQDDKLVLNISTSATQGLQLGNDIITFSARFSGNAHTISLPLTSILAIYAKETAQGIMFSAEEEAEQEKPPATKPPNKAANKPKLKVIK
ncbi:MAG TPA: ClpXP protease specificity-enhancing factor [Gammaproteobacteria bacterium]|nr:ClpXP protease specificity-enhancing factor [Gammaproteobacteria bacterium]